MIEVKFTRYCPNFNCSFEGTVMLRDYGDDTVRKWAERHPELSVIQVNHWALEN